MILQKLQVGTLFPSNIVDEIAHLQLELKRKAMGADLRPVRAADLCLSVYNLGDVELPKIKPIEEMLALGFARVPAFPVGIQGVAGLPNAIQPRSCVTPLVGEIDFLIKLQKMLTEGLRTVLGASDYNKDWAPSITIARLRSNTEFARTAFGKAIRSIPDKEAFMFKVETLHLLETQVDAAGTKLVSKGEFKLMPN